LDSTVENMILVFQSAFAMYKEHSQLPFPWQFVVWYGRQYE